MSFHQSLFLSLLASWPNIPAACCNSSVDEYNTPDSYIFVLMHELEQEQRAEEKVIVALYFT